MCDLMLERHADYNAAIYLVGAGIASLAADVLGKIHR